MPFVVTSDNGKSRSKNASSNRGLVYFKFRRDSIEITLDYSKRIVTMICARMIFAIIDAGCTGAYQRLGRSFCACWFA